MESSPVLVHRSRTDPIPVTLTVAGLVMSAVTLVLGVVLDLKGFGLNVLGNLVLVGPGLLLSNVIVNRIQTARANRRIEPLLRMVLHVTQEAVGTVQQALDMLGVEASLDVPSLPEDMAERQAMLVHSPWTALRRL